MPPLQQFKAAAKGTSLKPIADQYEAAAKAAGAALKEKQAKEWKERFGC
jgi:hypothetical protein